MGLRLIMILVVVICALYVTPVNGQSGSATLPCSDGLGIQPREITVMHQPQSLVLQAHVVLARPPSDKPKFTVSLTKAKREVGRQEVDGQVIRTNMNVLFIPDISPELLRNHEDMDRAPGYYLTLVFEEILNWFNFSQGETDRADIAAPGTRVTTDLIYDKPKLQERWNKALLDLASSSSGSPAASDLPDLWAQQSQSRNPLIVIFIRLRAEQLNNNNIRKEYPLDWARSYAFPIRVWVINLVGNPRENLTNDVRWGSTDAWAIPVPANWASRLDPQPTIQGYLTLLRQRLIDLKADTDKLRNHYLIQSEWKMLFDESLLQDDSLLTKEDTYLTVQYNQDGKDLTCSAPLRFTAVQRTDGQGAVLGVISLSVAVFAMFIYASAEFAILCDKFIRSIGQHTPHR
jgi:hypothetical protein